MLCQSSEHWGLTRLTIKRRTAAGFVLVSFVCVFTLFHTGVIQVRGPGMETSRDNWPGLETNSSLLLVLKNASLFERTGNWKQGVQKTESSEGLSQMQLDKSILSGLQYQIHPKNIDSGSAQNQEIVVHTLPSDPINKPTKRPGSEKEEHRENANLPSQQNQHTKTNINKNPDQLKVSRPDLSKIQNLRQHKEEEEEEEGEEEGEEEEGGKEEEEEEEEGGEEEGEEEEDNLILPTFMDQTEPSVVIPGRANRKHPNFYGTDKVHNLNWTSEMSEAIESELAERKAMIQEQCKSKTVITAPRQKKQIIFKNLLYVKDYNFVWCPIFKSASTTWVKNLLLLAGETKVDSGLHHRARQLYPLPQDTDALMLDQHTTKLMIVRHPLDRILSAYRDKMLRFRREGDPFVKLQRKIVKKYKDPRGVQLSPPSSSLSPDNNENDDRPADSPVPTFTQFLMKVLDDMQKIWSQEHKPINMHWRPFWYTCDPCALHFDLVAHVETLKRDQEYIIRKLGLQGTIFNMHTHASNFDSYNGTSDATKHYYSQVPLKLLKDIIRLYQPDFDLFGYSPDEYLDIVKEHDTGE